MSDYTPTTPVIRGAYIQLHSGASWESKQPRLSEFNRWLDEIRAKAWHEGYGHGREDHAEETRTGQMHVTLNPHELPKEPGA